MAHYFSTILEWVATIVDRVERIADMGKEPIGRIAAGGPPNTSAQGVPPPRLEPESDPKILYTRRVRAITSYRADDGDWTVFRIVDKDTVDPNPRWSAVAYGAPVLQDVDPEELARAMSPWGTTQVGEA